MSISLSGLLSRIVGKYRRTVSNRFCQRLVEIKSTVPFISFSFDDAPWTAFHKGGDILETHGARATFFVSLGMLGADSPSGIIASQDDLHRAVKDEHELGCHTYDHKDPWATRPEIFEQSILKNRQTLANAFPTTVFSTFAYPLCNPSPANKRRAGEYFSCCRGGGQTFNAGMVDFNLLKAFFLDVRNGDTVDAVRHLIDRNSECRGWLIFATHDVDDNPSPYGCTSKYFKEVVAYSASSGARLLTVGKACKEIQPV